MSATRHCIERDSVQGSGPKEVEGRNDSRCSGPPVINRGPELFQRFNVRTETKLILILILRVFVCFESLALNPKP